MATDYDRIASQYREAKQQPWRSLVEEHSFLKLIGALNGKEVVDVACGEGFFTRALKARGALTVVGTDISREMIALARAQEVSEPLGIEYRVEDARESGPRLSFDLAVSAYLLSQAHDRDVLAVLCRGLGRQLRPDGRLVTVIVNPDLYSFAQLDYREYGFSVRLEDSAREGASIRWTNYLAKGSLEIENYYLPIEAYSSALEEAGLRHIAFHSPSLAPAAAEDRAYWSYLLDYPPFVMLDAIRK